MLATIGTTLTSVIGWVGSVVTALFGESGALADLAPLIYIGVGVTLLLFGVKVVKGMFWGA